MQELIQIDSIYKTSAEFIALCQPLEKFKPQFIRLVQVYQDGQMKIWCSKPDILNWYYESGAWQYGFNEQNYNQYQSGYALTDCWEKSEQVLQHITMPAAQLFQIGSELIIYDKQEQVCNILEIGLSVNQLNANGLLMRHLNEIEQCFKLHLLPSNLISRANKPNSAILEQTLTPNLSKGLFNPQLAGMLGVLTARELESLYWLSKGKTGPDIALILGISPRTVEHYIKEIKNKLGVHTLFKLGQFLGQHETLCHSLFLPFIESQDF